MRNSTTRFEVDLTAEPHPREPELRRACVWSTVAYGPSIHCRFWLSVLRSQNFESWSEQVRESIYILKCSASQTDCTDLRISIIGIGLCDKIARRGAMPGWNPRQWAYHGDDGMTYGESGAGRRYGPAWGEGDVVGCGLDMGPGGTGTIFFTKNQKYLGKCIKRGAVFLRTDCMSRKSFSRRERAVFPGNRDKREGDKGQSHVWYRVSRRWNCMRTHIDQLWATWCLYTGSQPPNFNT